MTVREFLDQIETYNNNYDVRALVALIQEWAFKLRPEMTAEEWAGVGVVSGWASRVKENLDAHGVDSMQEYYARYDPDSPNRAEIDGTETPEAIAARKERRRRLGLPD